MPIDPKHLTEYLRLAYYAPQMGDNRDVIEYERWVKSDENVQAVCRRLGMTFHKAKSMLARGRYISRTRESTAQRCKKGKNPQWAILLPNRHFYALSDAGIYHPDQLLDKVSQKDKPTPAEAFALMETFRSLNNEAEE